MNFKNITLALGILTISAGTYAQKKNETSAALERNKAVQSLSAEKFKEAKESYLTAKEYIDLAAAHEDTKESQKTLWLKGDIYSALLYIANSTNDKDLLSKLGADPVNTVKTSLSKAYGLGKKYQDDVKSTVDFNVSLLSKIASEQYNDEKFAEAAIGYDLMAELGECVNELDTPRVFNAALCYEKSNQLKEAAVRYEKVAKVHYRGTVSAILASSAYRRSGDFAKAKAIIAEARKDNPTDKELLLESVNTSIDEGDSEGAQAALNSAIATDPNNKSLHYTIGTIYIDLEENEKAEEALNKALAIDPTFMDAHYQLGAHLVTWAGNIKQEATSLKLNDPNYDRLIAKSNETYKRALVPLEAYISANPDDKPVLNILFQLHKNLGNSEKALEYKKRMDAL